AHPALHSLPTRRSSDLIGTDSAPEMRTAALRTLVELDVPQQAQAIKLALADREKSVRVAGLDLLANMNIPHETIVALLSDVIDTDRKSTRLNSSHVKIS